MPEPLRGSGDSAPIPLSGWTPDEIERARRVIRLGIRVAERMEAEENRKTLAARLAAETPPPPGSMAALESTIGKKVSQ